MGYYVTLIDSDLFLDKKHFDDVYKKMCKLNDYDELKRGGSFGSNNDPTDGEKWNKNRWFSWMEYNYPEIYSDMPSILQALGFDMTFDDEGNLIRLSYHDKSGSEDYFLSCFAGFAKEGSYLEWEGEEHGDFYKYIFTNGNMLHQRGEMNVDYDACEPETYEFGKMSESDVSLAAWSKKWQLEREAQEIAKNNA